MLRFLDLSGEEATELGIEISYGAHGALVTSNSGDLFEIKHQLHADEQRDIRKYCVRFCFTGFVGERQTVLLRQSSSRRTIGYIFPVTALRDAGNIENEIIRGEWPRRFAEVGFRSAVTLENISKFSSMTAVEALRGRSLYLDEIISDNLSILVIGRDQMDAEDISLPVLELMLLKQGVYLLNHLNEAEVFSPLWKWQHKMTLSKPGPLVEREASIFTNLIKGADRDAIGVGAFMSLYQTMEFCIDHIFGWSVNRIAQSVGDVWEMKSLLSDVTNEKFRLGELDAKCLSKLGNRNSLDELRDSCRCFLDSMSIKYNQDSKWYEVLYKTRNIVVHNQLKMMRAANNNLQDVNVCLRAASLDVLFAFDQPAPLPAADILLG